MIAPATAVSSQASPSASPVELRLGRDKAASPTGHVVIMKVGPHSGMNLEQIVDSKFEEERIHGVHFWGYSGTLCQPRRVLAHVEDALRNTGEAPGLLLVETSSSYGSSIGAISHYSTDGERYARFDSPVQLQGAQFALVAQSLCKCNERIAMDLYRVAQGDSAGRPLSQYLRGRIGKVCAVASDEPQPADFPSLLVAYRATLAPPYAIWLQPNHCP